MNAVGVIALIILGIFVLWLITQHIAQYSYQRDVDKQRYRNSVRREARRQDREDEQ